MFVVQLVVTGANAAAAVPLLPRWTPTYDMALSTAIEPCNYSGAFDVGFASRFGFVDWDWSENKGATDRGVRGFT